MTVYQTILVLAVVFCFIGVHQATARLLRLLDDHLERFQGKLDVMMAGQSDHNDKIDIILGKLL